MLSKNNGDPKEAAAQLIAWHVLGTVHTDKGSHIGAIPDNSAVERYFQDL